MIQKITAVVALAIAGSATGQAVTGFTGGSQFDAFYGASTGDVVGWRFDVNTPIVLTDIGVWNADTQVGFEGLTSDHRVGIWNAAGVLLTSGSAGPGDAVVGDWTYDNVADVVLVPGERYTLGAMYTSGTDFDSYISSPTSMSLAAEINAGTNGVFPSIGDLGFVFPTEDSTNLARLGPNFLFRPVPAPASAALLGLGGLATARRRR
jgi:hypothetical protein